MISSEVLRNLDGRVGHITDADYRCGWLGVDEVPNVVEAVPNTGVARIVDQNKELQRRVFAASRNHMVDLEQALSLLYLHIFRTKNRNFSVIANRLVRDDHMNLGRAWGASFVLRINDARAESQRTQRNHPPEQKPVALHASS